jgi:hypothetical protein
MDLLLLARRADREDALGIPETAFALVAKAALPPQHRLAERALRRVVGWFDWLVEEGPQRQPELQQVPAHAGHLPVDRLHAALDEAQKRRLDGLHPAFQLVPIQGPLLELSPSFEHSVAELLAPGRELRRLPAAQPELHEVPDHVGPGDLPLGVDLVCAPAVAAHGPAELAQEALQLVRSPAPGHAEHRRLLRRSHPSDFDSAV